MIKRIETEFLFALTNPGAEKALKLEVQTMGLGWRPGYQRRGFVTFKADAAFSLESLEVEIACARRLCLSLGKFPTREGALERICETPEEGGLPLIQDARFEDRKMRGVAGGRRPAEGELVGTIVELGENEFWAGLHRHLESRVSPDAAGDGAAVMPGRSPSRAWLKLEEAVQFFDLKFTARDVVVELGASPGGVVLALLDRGVPVIGVDPAKMADVVIAHAISNRTEAPQDGTPWFYHCRKPAALVAKRDLGQGVTWFMSDMNQSPDVVLKELARFRKMAPSIRSALITLKLTDLEQVAEKEKWFAALREMGFKKIRLQQLAVHHKELALLATCA